MAGHPGILQIRKHSLPVLVASALAVGECWQSMGPDRIALHCYALLLLAGAGHAIAQTPQWIWHSSTNITAADTTVYFRKTFRTPPLTWNARLAVSADDEAEVYVNSVRVATCQRWNEPARAEVSVRLNQGDNVIAVRARNRSGGAGLLIQLNLNGQTNLVSDGSWLADTDEEPNWSALRFNAAHWQSARVLGPLGIAPWGDVLTRPVATAAE